VSDVVRFSVSVEKDLLERFDKYCRGEKYATRSEAVRQLVREKLTQRAWEKGHAHVAGTLTLVYDHHRSSLRDQLMDLQHQHTDLTISVMHVHMDAHRCMEVLALKGPADRLRSFASGLRGMKGILQGELVIVAECNESVEASHAP
jgi:CopG family nickel-responsive transcriptional regulator